MKKTINLLVIIIVLSNCKTKQPVGMEMPKDVKEIIIDMKANLNEQGDAYNIDSLKVNEDILSIFVQYSGGCQPHVFDLYNNGIATRSIPPQTTIILKHNANKDMCRALISQELKFNISKLKADKKATVILIFGDGMKISY
jgi:hypothetical protein